MRTDGPEHGAEEAEEADLPLGEVEAPDKEEGPGRVGDPEGLEDLVWWLLRGWGWKGWMGWRRKRHATFRVNGVLVKRQARQASKQGEAGRCIDVQDCRTSEGPCVRPCVRAYPDEEHGEEDGAALDHGPHVGQLLLDGPRLGHRAHLNAASTWGSSEEGRGLIE